MPEHIKGAPVKHFPGLFHLKKSYLAVSNQLHEVNQCMVHVEKQESSF